MPVTPIPLKPACRQTGEIAYKSAACKKSPLGDLGGDDFPE